MGIEAESTEVKRSVRELLKGSHFEGTAEEWKEQRGWIAKAIDRDGTILDFGCANGYLLKCLEDWSDHELEPFGVDTDPQAIRAAQEIFPDAKDHFVLSKDEEAGSKLPSEFDLIYWNVWDDSDFDQEGIKDILDHSVKMSVEKGGRLILGFYHPDAAENERKIKQLEDMGFKVERIETPKDLPDRGVVIDQIPNFPNPR